MRSDQLVVSPRRACALRSHSLGHPQVQITESVSVAEVSFTGDTTADVLTHPNNATALSARLLIIELTFVDDTVTVEHARKFGHMHIRELAAHTEHITAEHVLLIHFSARYSTREILDGLDRGLPPAFRAKCTPLLTGFSC